VVSLRSAWTWTGDTYLSSTTRARLLDYYGILTRETLGQPRYQAPGREVRCDRHYRGRARGFGQEGEKRIAEMVRSGAGWSASTADGVLRGIGSSLWTHDAGNGSVFTAWDGASGLAAVRGVPLQILPDTPFRAGVLRSGEVAATANGGRRPRGGVHLPAADGLWRLPTIPQRTPHPGFRADAALPV